jgi:hypothetical protein
MNAEMAGNCSAGDLTALMELKQLPAVSALSA